MDFLRLILNRFFLVFMQEIEVKNHAMPFFLLFFFVHSSIILTFVPSSLQNIALAIRSCRLFHNEVMVSLL